MLEGPEDWAGERVAAFRGCSADELADWVLPQNDRGRRFARVPRSVLLLDEFDMVCTHQTWHSEGAHDVVHYGRHNGVSLLGSCRRPSNVHRDMRALTTRIYLFRLTDALDLDTIGKQWGDETRAKVARLPRPRSDGSHYLTLDEEAFPEDENEGDSSDGQSGDPGDPGSGIEKAPSE